MKDPRAFLQNLFYAAIRRAQPGVIIKDHLPSPPKGRTVVIGAGKAAAAMAHTVDASWPQNKPMKGLVVTRYGHTPDRKAGEPARIDILEARHPVPDAAGVAASERIVNLLTDLTPDDLVICLMSGGASALLTLPIEGVSLEMKQELTRELLSCGAPIDEMNLVRSQLSKVKGGRLGKLCAPAKLVTLAISDVPGDDPAVIGSGPTIATKGSPDEALGILRRYGVEPPAEIKTKLVEANSSTEDPQNAYLAEQEVHLIATPWLSLCAAAELAQSCGVNAYVLSDSIEGESREVAKVHAEIAKAARKGYSTFERPCVILSGGETTVTIQNPATATGRGGRAGEFCLGLAQSLRDEPGIWAIAADTDGIDGVEDNAGAFVTPDTLKRAQQAGLSLQDHLDRHDAYAFFKGLDDLEVTGPTHTNVNDFRAILVL
jgi:glycerate 2-kinase